MRKLLAPLALLLLALFPALAVAQISPGRGGVTPGTCTSPQFVNGISVAGTITCSTPSGSGNVSTSGTITLGTVPVWGTTTSLTGTLSYGTTGNSTLIETSAGGTISNSLISALPVANLASDVTTIGSTGCTLGGTCATLAGLTLTSPTINGGALSGTVTGSPTLSGQPIFSNALSGTQTVCLGLSSGGALVESSGACGSGGTTTITLASGLASTPGTYNPGTQTVTNGSTISPQLFYKPITSSCTVDSTCSSGTSDSGYFFVATASSVTYTLPNPGSAGSGGFSFGYDGSHSYSLTTAGGTATFYGSCGAGATTFSGIAYAVQVFTDGMNYLCSPSSAGSGSTAFSTLTSGTNTGAAMLVGSGASFGATGSGTIAATSAPAAGLTGSTLPSGLTAASFTVTGAFTATGLVTNADLASDATTVNSVTCTLGSTCTVAAAASTLTGSTLASGVTGSSLTSVGTLGTLTVGGGVTMTGLATSGTIAGSVCATSAGVLLYEAGVNCEAGGGGTVTSVGLTVPSWLTVGGSPVTTAGTLAVTATTGETANEFLATPNGSSGAVGLRTIVAADLPTGTSGATIPLNNGGFTQSGTANFTSTFEVGGYAMTFPAAASTLDFGTGTVNTIAMWNSGAGALANSPLSVASGVVSSSDPIIAALPYNAQSGSSYALTSANAGYLTWLSNGSATTTTIPVGTTSGYGQGFALGLVPENGTTLTCTGGTCGNLATVSLAPGQYLGIAGNGTSNYDIELGLPPSGSANQVLATPNGSSGQPTLRALVTADIPAVYGDAATFCTGADGNLVGGAGTTTLTRDTCYNNVTLISGDQIVEKGFRLFVAGTLNLSAANANAIVSYGSTKNGSGGSGATGGTAGFPVSASGLLPPCTTATAGGASSATTGSAAPTPTNAILVGYGGATVTGSQGGAGASAAGAAAAGTVLDVAVQTVWPTTQLITMGGNQTQTVLSILPGAGAPGGSGGGGDAVHVGGAGGGGGGCGGTIFIAARVIARGTNTTAGIIAAQGGTGGAGAAANASCTAAGCGGGGGGEGGGGGHIYIIAGALTGSTITDALDVSSGAGGAGGNGVGTAGNGGGGGPSGKAGGIEVLNLSAATYTNTAPGTTSNAGGAASGLTGGTGGSSVTVQQNL